MARKRYWIGSSGPFFYDDSKDLPGKEHKQAGIRVEHEHNENSHIGATGARRRDYPYVNAVFVSRVNNGDKILPATYPDTVPEGKKLIVILTPTVTASELGGGGSNDIGWVFQEGTNAFASIAYTFCYVASNLSAQTGSYIWDNYESSIYFLEVPANSVVRTVGTDLRIGAYLRTTDIKLGTSWREYRNIAISVFEVDNTDTMLAPVAGEQEPGAPDANFLADKTSGEEPLFISFNDLSSGEPTVWAWDFGDGGTSSVQHPYHQYEEAGTYTVSLTASNAYGNSTETKVAYITIDEVTNPPNAEFTANPTSGTVALAVQFMDSSTGDPSSWAWDFGDGNTSTQQHPSHTYISAGVFSVSLTAVNADGSDTETKTDYITVDP